ncbi:hypothetical protein NQ317_009188 [Molorchus minor]|uniref:Uncharacterized protein n=1 Tax=Molorchus minor TaxID=1323400 RepID=A0ABQ9JQB4_9CUCU|nr:hypothetical protein NQ317_009188 [Molorchus minor]
MESSISPLPLTKPSETSCVDFEKLLQPLDSLPLVLDDDVKDETEDIFEEFYKDSFLRPYVDPSQKYLSINEGNMRTLEKFTDDFKRTIEEIRKEDGLNDPLFHEEEAIEDILKSKEKPPEKDEKFFETRGTPIEIEEQIGESTASSESNVWRMLRVNSTSKFKISSPLCHVFRQGEKHWLEKPLVSLEKVENSRIKCQKWLEGGS